MDLLIHKTVSCCWTGKHFVVLEHQESGLREKQFFLQGEDAEAESLLIYILVSLFWRSVTLKNVDIKCLWFILMHIQFSVLYLKVVLLVYVSC